MNTPHDLIEHLDVMIKFGKAKKIDMIFIKKLIEANKYLKSSMHKGNISSQDEKGDHNAD